MDQRMQYNPKDVFISWTSTDKKLKDNVVSVVEGTGYSCWESERDCDGPFREVCLKHVPLCKVFLIILTRNSVHKEYVRQELAEALKMERGAARIFPVIVGLQDGAGLVSDTGVADKEIAELMSSTSAMFFSSEEELSEEKNVERIQKKVVDLCLGFAMFVHTPRIKWEFRPCDNYISRSLIADKDNKNAVSEKEFYDGDKSAVVYCDGGVGKSEF